MPERPVFRRLKPLFVSSNNDSGHVRRIDDSVVVLGTTQLRKINEFVRNLSPFSADLLPGLQTQLDSLSAVSLQNAKAGVAGLLFVLSLRANTSRYQADDNY